MYFSDASSVRQREVELVIRGSSRRRRQWTISRQQTNFQSKASKALSQALSLPALRVGAATFLNAPLLCCWSVFLSLAVPVSQQGPAATFD